MEKRTKSIYLETYGCQMNLADSEIVLGIMDREGYEVIPDISRADVVLVNTCAVRDHAEQRVLGRISQFKRYKRANPGVVVGVLGCMAERLKSHLIDEESIVDLVVGPDEYRRLPELLEGAMSGEKGIAVRLSRVENYEDIEPLRTDGVSAWISVMRGCDKFCSFCVVPYTRGRERSRSLQSVVEEVSRLAERGYREITLLGQNVNSYRDNGHDFADLLDEVAKVDRNVRIRFTTSHPQDMSDKLIESIAAHENLCSSIHLPLQSGSNRLLSLMDRTYTREHYLKLVERIRRTIPGVSLSTDIIAGFCTETDEDHLLTIHLVEEVRYDGAFLFKYSPREHTKAYSWGDDVPDGVKVSRLNELIDLQQRISYDLNQSMVGASVEVLVEGPSKKSIEQWMGRTDTNKVVVFPKADCKAGEYARVEVERANSATLFGKVQTLGNRKAFTNL